jgi:hypothetical protein
MSINTQNDSNQISGNVVVIKPHQKSDIVFDSCERSINEIIDTTHKGSYSVLMRSDNDTELDFTKSTNKYKIHADGLINKIILENFPNKGSYFLRTNGFNVAAAKLIDGKLTFDLNKQNRSNKLSEMIKLSVGENEGHIEDRDSYLNTGRIDCFEILATEPLTDPCLLKLEGLFYDENKWEKCIRKYQVYPNEKDLDLNHLVKELDFYGNESFEMSLRIGGVLYGPFVSKPNNMFHNLIKFKFSGWEDILIGVQNRYLSNDLNKQVINCSRLNNISVVSNVKQLHFVNYTYKTFDFEWCAKKFLD